MAAEVLHQEIGDGYPASEYFTLRGTSLEVAEWLSEHYYFDEDEIFEALDEQGRYEDRTYSRSIEVRLYNSRDHAVHIDYNQNY